MSILDRFKKKNIEDKIKASVVVGAQTTPRNVGNVLQRPWITEKSVALSKLGKYIFLVPSRLASQEIKKSVEALYKVSVKNINIINIKPKSRRLGKSMGKIPGMRKAIITLEKGQSIDILPH